MVPRFRLFHDFKNPILQSLYNFEHIAQRKMREHQEKDFVENDVDFNKLFIEIKEMLLQPLEEIKTLGEEYKNGTSP